MKDYTICKPQETTQKKTEHCFLLDIPQFPLHQKGNAQITFMHSYFYVQTVLDSNHRELYVLILKAIQDISFEHWLSL